VDKAICRDALFLPLAPNYHALLAGKHCENKLDFSQGWVVFTGQLYPERLLCRGRCVLAKGVKVTGATVHYVNEIPDGGEIIMQKAVEVKDGDTPETLQRRVMEEAEWIILPAAAEKVCAEIIKERKGA